MQFQINSEKTQALMTGDLTFADHASFKALIGSLLEGRGSPIVIDLSELDFIDSAGLGMLLLIRDEANKAARKLVLRGPIGQVKRMFGVTNPLGRRLRGHAVGGASATGRTMHRGGSRHSKCPASDSAKIAGVSQSHCDDQIGLQNAH